MDIDQYSFISATIPASFINTVAYFITMAVSLLLYRIAWLSL